MSADVTDAELAACADVLRRLQPSDLAGDEATAQLAAAVAGHRMRFYADAETARTAIEQTLQLDIRSVHQGRGQAVSASAPGQAYSCRFDVLQLDFTTFATHVLVTRCEAAAPLQQQAHS